VLLYFNSLKLCHKAVDRQLKGGQSNEIINSTAGLMICLTLFMITPQMPVFLFFVDLLALSIKLSHSFMLQVKYVVCLPANYLFFVCDRQQ
jgi:hypothetical protein